MIYSLLKPKTLIFVTTRAFSKNSPVSSMNATKFVNNSNKGYMSQNKNRSFSVGKRNYLQPLFFKKLGSQKLLTKTPDRGVFMQYRRRVAQTKTGYVSFLRLNRFMKFAFKRFH
jgi:hypothetical protein